MHLCGVFFKGKAEFVANLDTGCSDDDETGLLFLQSPAIDLPVGALVPRAAFNHWFAIELGWDGGNLKLSVNGGPFTLIPTSAIEFNTYESKLNSAADGNTNPLAAQPAYTGASDGLQGAWEQVRVNLYGLAKPGDSICFRFDFGIDVCNGVVGWYVDEVLIDGSSPLCGSTGYSTQTIDILKHISADMLFKGSFES